MALTGQLSDLSLAELIEFFCNQRKTGRLKIAFRRADGVFFIEEGELVDAQLGSLEGAEAVYYALTLPNAKFDFSANVRAPRRTINERWTQVVLEGLRRMDEGVVANEDEVFAGTSEREFDDAPEVNADLAPAKEDSKEKSGVWSEATLAQLSQQTDAGSRSRRNIFIGGVAVVLVGGVTAVGALAGLSGKKNNAPAAPPVVAAPPSASLMENEKPSNDATAADNSDKNSAPQSDAAKQDDLMRREREAKERARQLEKQQQQLAQQRAEAAKLNPQPVPNAAQPNPQPVAPQQKPQGGQTIMVRVTVDEAGNVSQASVSGSHPGMEAYESSALRVARSKRFPAGKAGVVTVPVKIN